MADDRNHGQSTPLRQNFNPDEEEEYEHTFSQEVERPNATPRLGYMLDGPNEPATPPYRRDPSTSQLDLGGRMPPEYKSQYAASSVKLGRGGRASDEDYLDEKASRRGRTTSRDEESEDDHESTQYATASTHPRKAVHYTDTDGEGLLHNGALRSGKRVSDEQEQPRSQSRASSAASSDADMDDDEMYDWSDEGDLVDEEAKFEKKMGRDKTAKGWGLWRSV